MQCSEVIIDITVVYMLTFATGTSNNRKQLVKDA